MHSEFEKNQFLPNELARGKVFVRNGACNIDVARVSFYVE